MEPITGKIVINVSPDDAEVYIDGRLRGRGPATITDIDMGSAKQLELRAKDYRPYVQDLVWPADGVIRIDRKLER
jgi:hypothetical protein